MTAAAPGCDEILLTAPDSPRLCHSLACARGGRGAEVIVTFGVLNDPSASLYAREALWRESWGKPVPMCAACWKSCRQVAITYRPGLVVIDAIGPLPAAAQISGGRA